ncbi:MAG: hypothetical protein CFE37_08590 [Alphaproteobacteria bacterium PA4]|nr:MAG: hypothetical protein CFE37_08590 [Alphaproteobacteria bacterium PA4]
MAFVPSPRPFPALRAVQGIFAMGALAFLYVANDAPPIWGPRLGVFGGLAAAGLGLAGVVGGWGWPQARRAGMAGWEWTLYALAASALALVFGGLALNDLASPGTTRVVEQPIAAKRVQTRPVVGEMLSVRTVGERGQLVWLKRQPKEFARDRVGGCYRLTVRRGALGLDLVDGAVNARCSPARGVPGKQARLVFDAANPEGWRWG